MATRMSIAEKVEALRRVPMFAGSPTDQLTELASGLEERIVPHGTVLAREGRPSPNECMIVVSGEAIVTRDGAKVATARRGDLISDPSHHGVTVTSVTLMQLLVGPISAATVEATKASKE